jgi:hypothetical protein
MLMARAVRANPTALFSWRMGPVACSMPGADEFVDPTGYVRLNVGVTGLTEPYIAYALTIEVLPQDPAPFLDAWRFDAEGCQAAMWTDVDYRPPPAGNGCGSLVQNAVVTAHAVIRTFEPGRNRLRIEFGLALKDPQVLAYPGSDYLVASIPFDHLHSVFTMDAAQGNCGGVERAMCFWLRSLTFERPDGTSIDAERPTTVVTANAASFGGPAACGPEPARAATWGGIKAQYR